MHRIIMPKLGLTMEEGMLAKWHRREGDQVEEGEPLFEVETDKATNEVEAPFSGTSAKILLEEGGSAKVLQVVARMLKPAEEPPEQWPDIQPLAGHAKAIGSARTIPEGAPEELARPSSTEAKVISSPIEWLHKPRIRPRPRRLAEPHGLPLHEVTPSGPRGPRVGEGGSCLSRGRRACPARSTSGLDVQQNP
jgi:pyruvate dehydrogenase E2 component (dihydrolipoamide acetyltransferase)